MKYIYLPLAQHTDNLKFTPHKVQEADLLNSACLIIKN